MLHSSRCAAGGQGWRGPRSGTPPLPPLPSPGLDKAVVERSGPRVGSDVRSSSRDVEPGGPRELDLPWIHCKLEASLGY